MMVLGGGAVSTRDLYINVRWFRGGLVFEAHRLLCHSNLGLKVIKRGQTGKHTATKSFLAHSEPNIRHLIIGNSLCPFSFAYSRGPVSGS